MVISHDGSWAGHSYNWQAHLSHFFLVQIPQQLLEGMSQSRVIKYPLSNSGHVVVDSIDVANVFPLHYKALFDESMSNKMHVGLFNEMNNATFDNWSSFEQQCCLEYQ